jgi:hypothetical protein
LTKQGECSSLILPLRYTINVWLRSLSLIAASILLWSISTFSAAEDELGFNIIVTTYPPFIDENAKGGGISLQLLTTLLAPFNQSYQVLNLPPARAHLLMAKDDYLISVLPPGHASSNHLRFELIKTDLHYTLFQLKSRNEPWQNIFNKKIGTLNFRFGKSYAQNLQTQGAKIVTIPNFESGLKMLHAGRVDFLLGIDQTIYNAAEKIDMADEIIADDNKLTSFGALAFYVNLNNPMSMDLIQYLYDQEILEIKQTQ